VTVATSAAASVRAGEHTVDEVAELTGTTVRTIRWYQSQGLLPAPRRSGRVAVYDADHLARLEAIRYLQSHGLTLTAIRRLLDRAPGNASATALAFIKAAVAQTSETEAEVITVAEGAQRLGIGDPGHVDARLVEELGIVRVLDDGRWQVLAPAAFEAAAELAQLGVPLDVRVEVTRVLQRHTHAMAQAIVEMFVDYLWRPSEMTVSDDPTTWATLADAVASLRPLAATSVASMFDTALAREAEAAAERELTPPPLG
jgi:DNA-binding transcriptional MerR regulator